MKTLYLLGLHSVGVHTLHVGQAVFIDTIFGKILLPTSSHSISSSQIHHSTAQAASFEPKPRVVPSSAVRLGQLHQWGGRKDDTVSADVFNFHSESWRTITTQGAPPLGIASAASAGSDHYLYTYGGIAENDKSLTGCLHRLDTKTSTLSQLAAHSTDSPMKKYLSGMIVYQNSVLVIGGVGIPQGPLQPGSKRVKNNDDRGRGWSYQ